MLFRTLATYNLYDKNVDKVIKAGKELQNISNNSNRGVSDAFYFSMTGMDNAKYRGLYGDTLSARGKVYETKIGVNKSIKVASEKSAVNALSELVKFAEPVRLEKAERHYC